MEDKKGGKGGKGDAKGGKGGDVDLAKIEKEAKADAVRCAASEPLISCFCTLLCHSRCHGMVGVCQTPTVLQSTCIHV